MARPKSLFTMELAERAKADLEVLDRDLVILKLHAIAAASRRPVAVVADLHGVAPETVWRWATAYAKDGLDGLRRKRWGPRSSKLNAEQKATVLSWLKAGETAKGEPVHWTLDSIRAAIAEEFNVSLARNSIWVWLRKEGWRPKVSKHRRR